MFLPNCHLQINSLILLLGYNYMYVCYITYFTLALQSQSGQNRTLRSSSLLCKAIHCSYWTQQNDAPNILSYSKPRSSFPSPPMINLPVLLSPLSRHILSLSVSLHLHDEYSDPCLPPDLNHCRK